MAKDESRLPTGLPNLEAWASGFWSNVTNPQQVGTDLAGNRGPLWLGTPGIPVVVVGGDTVASGSVTLPNGQEVPSSGNIAKDFLNGIFGISPLDSTSVTETTSGEPLKSDATLGGGMFDFGTMIARVAIIILGFIFVAVGLSMFSGRSITVVTGGVATS